MSYVDKSYYIDVFKGNMIDENDIDFNLYSIRKNKYATGKSNEFHFKKGIL